MKQPPVYYFQTDEKWKDIDYSAAGEKTTIGKSGCGPTCMAMVIATWKDSKITPKDTCKWALEHGYKAKNQGTYYSYFAPQGKAFGLTVQQLNGVNIRGLSESKANIYHKKALEAIANGDLVIACMGKGLWTFSGHFVLVFNIVEGDNTIYINDPNSMLLTRTRADYNRFKSEVKYYFICKKPDDYKEHSDNYYKVKEKYGFEDDTMKYLEDYKYSDSLLSLMLMGKNDRKFQINTIYYLMNYKYGKNLIEKLNNVD